MSTDHGAIVEDVSSGRAVESAEDVARLSAMEALLDVFYQFNEGELDARVLKGAATLVDALSFTDRPVGQEPMDADELEVEDTEFSA